ncbi:hypothetical protein [Burkholderia anthina]|uniref:Uncharacterized protein n=1 Tax=Burkholderia anthina TaxID=179879 RepID=A0A6P2GDR6_9BURK|nr:hypothetical protein [Burkholderia anthina]MBM2769878.1 hypothetical protein [Burkholderia anthina]VVU51852.1 hypothetical protein BAN20980_04575 [Burkholderia anthina]
MSNDKSRDAFSRAPRTDVAGAVQPSIEYRYEGGTFWCDLGPAERMRPDFKGVYRLKAGEFPVWGGDEPSADAAAAPADERAALVERVLGMFEAWPKDELGPTDEPESQYRFGYNTALEDVLTALDVPPARGSRAAASQPAAAAGQEAATMPYLYVYEYDSHFGLHREFSPRSWNGMKPTRTIALYTAPPAQVATRQGLTDEQRGVLTYVNQPDNVGAWRLGEACRAAKAGGDPIDHGLSLLKELQDRGYGVIALLEGDKHAD